MVLQKSPMKANIWGYLHNSAVNNEVSVELNNKKYNAVYIKGDYSNMYIYIATTCMCMHVKPVVCMNKMVAKAYTR